LGFSSPDLLDPVSVYGLVCRSFHAFTRTMNCFNRGFRRGRG
jgi:hypothetical protein